MAAGPSESNQSGTPVGLAERWNGADWSIQSTPNTPGAEPAFLLAVSCGRPSDCMAVGGTGTDNPSQKALVAEHSEGAAWRVVPVPDPPGMTPAGGNLESVSCTPSSFCMAIGAYQNSSGQSLPLAERWNGAKWRVVPIPHLAGAQNTLLNGVSCSSPLACTTVADVVNAAGIHVAMAERWNGTRWRIQTMPSPDPAGTSGAQLTGVDCPSATACTAVGAAVDSAGDPVGPALAEQWNGTRWRIQPTPNPPTSGGGILTAVACPSPTICTAAGAAVDPQGNPIVTLAERWNGRRWRIQPTPNPAGVRVGFKGVDCTSSSACTAVGGSFGNAGLAERWNGTSWRIQPTPNPPGPIYNLMLWSVTCPQQYECITAGKYATFSPLFIDLAPQLTLIEQWNGSTATAQSTTNSKPLAKFDGTPTGLDGRLRILLR
jgi:hypothetical protein